MKFIKNNLANRANNELELLKHYRVTGNLQLLGKLYEPYMSLVFGVCLKYYRDEAKSKDAVMQIFEALIQKLKYHEVSNFKSWLYTLSRNYCLMDLRNAGRHEQVNLDDSQLAETLTDFDLNELHENQLTAMEQCIVKLPEDQRICIELFYLQQRCYKELIELTGFDMNKVKSCIQNGKRNLKICMTKNSGN